MPHKGATAANACQEHEGSAVQRRGLSMDAERNGSRLKLAVVGLGYWGPNLLRVLSEKDDVEVAYICDLDPGRLDSFARRYPSARATTRYDEILADDSVDAVVL